MAKERCLEKSLLCSAEVIKKQMKKTRNKDHPDIGKYKSVLLVLCQILTNTSKLLKNYRGNNRVPIIWQKNVLNRIKLDLQIC
uniref:Uncharacterized protein n=1 Tax=Ailuropoda melanoleuca TaxID=9646 RepID=A0A7N5KMI9_AILME